MTRGERAVAAARRQIGVRFRAQGRDPEFGLDCVGLVMIAHRIPKGEMASDYRMRGANDERLLAEAGRWFRPVAGGRAKVADVVVAQVAADQTHVLLLTETGFIHADVRRRCVIETPGAPPWPITNVLRRRSRRVKG